MPNQFISASNYDILFLQSKLNMQLGCTCCDLCQPFRLKQFTGTGTVGQYGFNDGQAVNLSSQSNIEFSGVQLVP